MHCKDALRQHSRKVVGRELPQWCTTQALALQRRSFLSRTVSLHRRGHFFEYLSLPLSIDLNTNELQKAFHKLQSSIHPDQQTSPTSPTCSTPTVDDSAYANAAYETLRDPFRRCRYLLALETKRREVPEGVLQDEEADALLVEADDADSSRRVRLSPTFLMEMMELNELIFELNLGNPTDYQTLLAKEVEVKQKDSHYFQLAKEHWRTGDLEALRVCILQWTFINNLKQHIHHMK